MRKSRYSYEQIAAPLRQAEIGTPVADITRKVGISEVTFYVRLTLDRHVLQDVLKPPTTSTP